MGVLSILAGLQELALRTLQELAKTTTACSNAMNGTGCGKSGPVGAARGDDTCGRMEER